MTVGEGESDLCDAQTTMPHEQLKQDLEPARSEHVQIDSRPPDKEEPAHRIGYAAKAHREQQLGRRPADGRDQRTDRPEPVGASRAAIPAGDREVGPVPLRCSQQGRDDLGRVLEVRVQHARPRGTDGVEAVDDGPTQAARPLAAPSVDERNLEGAAASLAGGGADDDRCVVVAVVDEDDFGGDAGDGGGDATQQLLDVGCFVAGRHKHGKLGEGLDGAREGRRGILAYGEHCLVGHAYSFNQS